MPSKDGDTCIFLSTGMLQSIPAASMALQLAPQDRHTHGCECTLLGAAAATMAYGAQLAPGPHLVLANATMLQHLNYDEWVCGAVVSYLQHGWLGAGWLGGGACWVVGRVLSMHVITRRPLHLAGYNSLRGSTAGPPHGRF